jgi:short-subunit dehydrogenase
MMNVTRAVLPQMRARKAGRIVNVASICGRMTLPLYTAYCSTKWAVEGFSEALAFEVSQFNIKVKIIEPGVFRTEFFDRSQELARNADLTDYDSFVGTVQPNMEGWEKAAPPPDAVARAIWSAANDRLPRLRYSPRGAAVLAARRFVPGALYVRGVRRLLDAW